MKTLRGARRPLPAWLAALALVWQLLAPGLCLTQMASAAPLGAICSAMQGDAPAAGLPEAGVAAHALDHCGHCLASPAVIVGSLPHSAAPAPRAPASAAPPDSVAIAAPGAWRPPPRGPPHAA